jgi:eukaryotic-like serine/threonine-protein kinase
MHRQPAGFLTIVFVVVSLALLPGAVALVHAAATPMPQVATPGPAPAESGAAAGGTLVRDADGMTMVYVPAGKFLMGSQEGEGESNEHPQHEVSLDAFWIDRTEVTNAQYRRCLDAGACKRPTYWDDGEYNGVDGPVVGVTWLDAQAYCTWVGARLPSEAEWEKAARGTDGRRYPWGDDAANCDKANYWGQEGGCVGDPGPVAARPSGASPYGALDMAGNAWEWCQDWYKSYPGSSNPVDDTNVYRVLRGFEWGIHSSYGFRCAYRSYNSPYGYSGSDGFRLAR